MQPQVYMENVKRNKKMVETADGQPYNK